MFWDQTHKAEQKNSLHSHFDEFRMKFFKIQFFIISNMMSAVSPPTKISHRSLRNAGQPSASISSSILLSVAIRALNSSNVMPRSNAIFLIKSPVENEFICNCSANIFRTVDFPLPGRPPSEMMCFFVCAIVAIGYHFLVFLSNIGTLYQYGY